MPFLLALPLLGTRWRSGRPAIPEAPQVEGSDWRLGPAAIGLLLAGALLAGPLARGAAAVPRDRPGRWLLVDGRNAVHLVGEVGAPEVAAGGNRVRVAGLSGARALRPYPPLWQRAVGVEGVPAGTSVAIAFDPARRTTEYVELATSAVPPAPALVPVCAGTLRRGRLHLPARGCAGEVSR
jgi:hypothetical protein